MPSSILHVSAKCCQARDRLLEAIAATDDQIHEALIPTMGASRPRKSQVAELDFTDLKYLVQALAEGRAKNLSKVQPWIDLVMSLSKHRYFDVFCKRKTPFSRSPGAIRPRRKAAPTNPQSLPGFAVIASTVQLCESHKDTVV